MKLLILNGPNINMLGVREPDIYGNLNYEQLCSYIMNYSSSNYSHIQLEFYQSNHEGLLIDKIHENYGIVDGIIFNPGAYTHTSIALLDAIKCVNIPTIEVHLSDVSKREEFRQVSFIRSACIHTVSALGKDSYTKAIDLMNEYLKGE